jgi:predicted phage terminase large subunit-like protein
MRSLLCQPKNRSAFLKGLDAAIIKAQRERDAKLIEEYTEQALGDLQGIRRRSKTLHGFVREAWPILEPSARFVDGWVIKAICDHLEAVTRGDIQYLMVNVPPGFMKSLLVSVLWPAWEWGPANRPGLRYLATSYSKENVERDNGKMAALVLSDWYQALWGSSVKRGKRWGIRKFSNTALGDRVIIDDPHSTKTAESDAERKATVKLFRESITDRLNDLQTSAVVIIMQRLHSLDVAGTIIAEPDAFPYTTLVLPMEFEEDRRCTTYLKDGAPFFTDPRSYDGELLFEERFPELEVSILKKAKGSYAWAGQYQQRPSPREGGLFEVEMITVLGALPAGKRKTSRGWDFAATKPKQGSDPDWTAGVRLSRDEHGFVYIEDVIRAQNTGNEIRKLFVKTTQADGGEVRVRYPQDPGAAGKTQAEDLSRAISGYMFKFGPVTGAKDLRATPFANQVEAGNVFMLKAPWNAAFIDELRAFPNGKHDDSVDAVSDAFNDLANVVPGEGLIEYYRQEVERERERMGQRSRPISRSDLVGLIPPPFINCAYGIHGDEFRTDQEGVMWVLEGDVKVMLSQPGWTLHEPVIIQD